METLTVVGVLLGTLTLAVGVVMLVGSIFRRRPLKKWALTAVVGFVVLVLMSVLMPTDNPPPSSPGSEVGTDGVGSPTVALELRPDHVEFGTDENPAPNALGIVDEPPPSSPGPEVGADADGSSATALEPRSDYVEFGTGENPTSDVLGLVGVSKTFTQETDLWLRLRLRKSAGRARVDFILQQQQGGPGWHTLNTWASTVDPESNIFRDFEPTLQSLEPAEYKVFVLIGDEKRAEGLFTIIPAPVLVEATLTLTPPGTTPAPAAESMAIELRLRAERWATHISSNEWVTAYSRYAPDLMAACSLEDLEEYQRLFLAGEEATWSVEIADIEVDGNLGNVYFNLIQGGDHFAIREIPTPNKWIFERGEWWYGPDEPEKRCVRYSPTYAPKGLGMPQEEFMTRFVSDVSDIYGKLSSAPCNEPLLDFKPYSEEYKRQGTLHSSLIQQRLPRMQPVVLYKVPGGLSLSVEEPKVELQLTGESHELNRVYVGGFEDYFESDPCFGTRILPYFMALGKLLAPEWERQFYMLAWFRGEQGAVRAYYTESGDEVPSDQILDFQLEYQGVKVFVRYEEPCNPVRDPFCPLRHSRWGMAFSTNIFGLESFLPPPTCESNANLHYIETSERCPGQ